MPSTMSPPRPQPSASTSARSRFTAQLEAAFGPLGARILWASAGATPARLEADGVSLALPASEVHAALAGPGLSAEAFRFDGAAPGWVAIVLGEDARPLSEAERALVLGLVETAARLDVEEAWRDGVGETGFLCEADMGISLAMPDALSLLGLPPDSDVRGRPLGEVLEGWRLSTLEPGEVARGHHRGLGRAWVCHPARVGEGGAPRHAIRFQDPDVRILQSGPQQDFLQALRHDVRSPLTALRGLVSVLIDEPEMPSEERQQLLELLSGEAERVVNFVEDYLVAMRLRISPEPQQVRTSDLRTSVQQYIATLEANAAARRIALTTSLEEAVVEVDVPLVDAFVRNFVGAVFRMADPGASISLVLRRSGLRVRGAGPGQFRQLLDRPFTTLARSTSSGKRTPGAALGLFLAKKIADVHGWTVTLGPDGDGFAVHVDFG